MFEHHVIPVGPVVTQPAEMPIDILLALPPGQIPGVAESFNVLDACNALLGKSGWPRATRVLNPKVWAPSWDDERLGQLLMQAGLDSKLVGEIRATSFPGTTGRPETGSQEKFDIVHYVGEVFADASEDAPMLVLGDTPNAPIMKPGRLRDVLVDCGARLLILQVGVTRHKALKLAQFVASAGGPAVVVLSGRHSGELRNYIFALYAGLVHNQPLPAIVLSLPTVDSPDVTLFSSPERDTALQFNEFMDRLRTELGSVAIITEANAASLRAAREARSPYLHRADAERLERDITSLETHAAAARTRQKQLDDVRHIPWDHESDGVIPVADVVEQTRAAPPALQYPELISELERLQTDAPRVMNANFADPLSRTVLSEDRSLVFGGQYDLLVDLGPRWSAIPSLVRDSVAFPEKALPPDKDGYVIQVTVVSSDFSPSVATGDIWLPRNAGRSYPMVKGERSEAPGPIALRLQAPRSESGNEPLTARARLCLSYENNVLQSAEIIAHVHASQVPLATPNTIVVDYVLSGTLQNVGDRFATRDLRFPGEPESARHGVDVGFALNDDGAGNHRIILTGDTTQPAGWVPYSPEGAADILRDVRKELLNCFWRRNSTLEAEPQLGLDANNGKSFEQFRRDLFVLAQLGRRLYNAVFVDVRPEGALDALAWGDALRQRLVRRTVIQVARTQRAEYALPWGLMYEYPLGPLKELRTCDVLRQWNDAGIRNKLPADRCPYADDENHQEKIVCPYGFWGLKHVIEQPLSALDAITGKPRDAERFVSINGTLPMAAGWTTDAELDAACIADHQAKIVAITGLRFADPQPNPAYDLNTVRGLLASPSLVYFLCHGEYDAKRKEPYLGIGPRDSDAAHRVYPSTILDWAQTPTTPNLRGWGQARPLVFINGCHTADLAPAQILNFVSAFGAARASGVIGTEVNVRLPLATKIAESLLRRLASGEPAGTALYELRWELANKGNLLGLAYTLYALSDLRFGAPPAAARAGT